MLVGSQIFLDMMKEAQNQDLSEKDRKVLNKTIELLERINETSDGETMQDNSIMFSELGHILAEAEDFKKEMGG